MNFIFTVCSNNYLAQASILANSVNRHQPDTSFVIILCDVKRNEIDYSDISAEVIEIGAIEHRIDELSVKYNIIELNTCIKPRAIEYFFEERKADTVIYLDPDIKLYRQLSEIYTNLPKFPILLTPHIYNPIPIDGKKPGENTFLNYGIYNLGFIALGRSEEVDKLVAWWKYRTYEAGFFNPEDGLFVDQLPLNHAPIFFNGVKVLENMGLNMAPWNLHERILTHKNGSYHVNEKDELIFYHFSSFMVGKNELPLHHYDRFTLSQRPDLQDIYREYDQEMVEQKYHFYQQFKSYYSEVHERFMKKKKSKSMRIKHPFKKLFDFGRDK